MAITIGNTNKTLLGAKNPVWADSDETIVELDCKFSHYADLGITENDGYLKFIAMKTDPEPHGVEIYNNCIAEVYGKIGHHVPPTEPPEGWKEGD